MKTNNKTGKINNLIKILSKLDKQKGGEKKAVQIIKNWATKHKINIARVKSVLPLSDFEIKEIKQSLQKVFNQEVWVFNEVDKSILGGIKIIYGSRIIDNSLSFYTNKFLKTKEAND